jgi:hypothetical protein
MSKADLRVARFQSVVVASVWTSNRVPSAEKLRRVTDLSYLDGSVRGWVGLRVMSASGFSACAIVANVVRSRKRIGRGGG